MKFIDLKTQYEMIEDKIQSRINTVLSHGQYIMGPEVKELEDQLANYVGAKHAIACSSGTDALVLALMALDIKPGDEIITSPFSFFASSEVIVMLGAKPVFVDICPNTYNIDPALIKAAITPKTKAIMAISLYGQCSEMNVLQKIAIENNIALIEDAAQSFGAKHHGSHSGNLADISCTSFFPSKPLGGYGDSGACFTNNSEVAEKLRQLLSHGQTARYQHQYIGINGRMDSLQAAVLIEKLAIFENEVHLRQKVAAQYKELLNNVAKVPTVLEHNTSVFAQYTIEVEQRDKFCQEMAKLEVPTAVHYPSLLPFQPALMFLGYKEGNFPVAENACKRVVSLPMHPYLTMEEQVKVSDAVKKSLA